MHTEQPLLVNTRRKKIGLELSEPTFERKQGRIPKL
jgi:hypothetical protein